MAELGQTVRRFDLEEAERMLPLVRSILSGIVTDHAERRALAERLDDLDPAARRGVAGGEITREIEALTRRLVEAIEELTGLGVELKGVEPGLVDFPTRLEDRDAYLCWRLGEEGIRWWHPVETGFAGRRPVERDPPDPD